MTEKDLLEIIDSWENLEITIQEIGNRPEYFRILFDIALYNKEQKSWRAAYMVDKIHDKFPELVIPFLKEIIQQLKVEKNSSKKRHFMKLISMNTIQPKYHGFLVETCLKALTSAKEPPAVRVHAMQILFNISEMEPDLKPEILAIIEHEMEYHSTAGIISKGSKLTNKLRKQVARI